MVRAKDIMKFGELITVDHKLVRRAKHIDGKEHKIWQKQILKNPIDAILIGQRTLSDGHVYYWGDEIGFLYDAHKYFKALLVVSDMNTKPFYVKINNS